MFLLPSVELNPFFGAIGAKSFSFIAYDLVGTCIIFVQPCLQIFGVLQHFLVFVFKWTELCPFHSIKILQIKG